jgi:hypothetical protein
MTSQRVLSQCTEGIMQTTHCTTTLRGAPVASSCNLDWC